MKRLAASLFAVALLAAAPAVAQNATYQVDGAPAGQRSQGMTLMCMDSNGRSTPLALCDLWPEVTPAYRGASPEQRGRVVVISPNSASPDQYPGNSTPIAGNSTGSTGAVVGTLTAVAGRKNYLCGFTVSAIGGTAAVGPITVAGLNGGSMLFEMSSSAAGVTLQQAFSPCIPASANNTAITVTTTADGTATAVDVNTWGFRK